MKNLYTFLVLLCCLSTFGSNGKLKIGQLIDPPLLVKMITDSGTAGERHWNFNTDGLIANVQNNVGTVIAVFTYDDNNNLLTADFSSGFFYSMPAQSHNFTYDGTNHIATINGYDMYYFPGTNSYRNTTDPINYSEWNLHPNGLLKSENRKAYNINEILVTEYGTSTSLDEFENVIARVDTQYGNVYPKYWKHLLIANPLQQAFLPLCKGMAVRNFGESSRKFADAQYYSANCHSEFSYSWEDPESSKISYELNAFNQPVKQFETFFYLGVEEVTALRTLYYYEGYVIP